MFKPKQIAPFFSMTPMQLSETLREIHVVYPLHQTPLGSFLLTEKDLSIIETYLNTKMLFGNKKLTLVHLKDYIERKREEEENVAPDWLHMIQSIS
ncbi:hypothetical protein R3O67_33795 [Bacillus cereus]|uniref:hypothetical protein n=1 Tax=Bacillus cereus TaxID=1396 RepID=UPI00307A8905